MLNALTKGLTKLFGTKSERDIKALLPRVTAINKAFSELQNISDQELRQRSFELRDRIDQDLKPKDDEIQAIYDQIAENPEMDVLDKDDLYNKIDSLEEERNKELEKILDHYLEEGFAIMKETARRFLNQDYLEVEATDFDHTWAEKHGNVEVKDGKAFWYKRWNAAGTEVEWDMVHYDVQLIGGIVLHQGKIAEMATGEGKTLVATLPAFLNALARRGVHIVTVNDYLAKRDAEWMGPLFHFHQLTVDCIDKYQPHSEERTNAYRADVTYGTNNEFGFDYLRDNMVNFPEEQVQRRLHFAMVDEVDSVLIDDARTPLIISGPVPQGDQEEFEYFRPFVHKLVEAQKSLVQEFINEAKKLLKEDNEKEAGLPLFRAHRGLPKAKPLIKLLSVEGNKTLLTKTESFYLQDNAKKMPEADKPLYFTIDEKNNQIDLTEKGLAFLAGEVNDDDFFVLPDLSTGLDAIERDETLSDEEKNKKKDEFINEYTLKTKRIHTVNQLLKAYTLFENDVDYIVRDGKVMIVDEQTGRVMEGRRYSDGLHQALEAKERVKIEDPSQTYATVTLQNFFRMYHKLAGMTGTAETEATEFWEIYKLDVVVIPTNKPIVRDDRADMVYRTVREKYDAAVQEIMRLREAGRPILVGTTSVDNSMILSRMLKFRKIPHQVLNAKYHAKEAEIIAEAGKSGTVTIATNMAGRGTDIKLSEESRQAGGLAIVGTERHEARRVDRQLRGRAGRQGDPGSSQFYVSLEDNLMRMFISTNTAKVMDRLGLKEGEVIQHSMITRSIEKAQRKVEENHYGVRKKLLEYDDVMNSQRELIYKKRKHALFGDRLQVDIINMMFEACETLVEKYKDRFEEMKFNHFKTFGFETEISEGLLASGDEDEPINFLYEEAYKVFKERMEGLRNTTYPVFQRILEENESQGGQIETIIVPFTDGQNQINVLVPLRNAVDTEGEEVITSLQKQVTLRFIDQEWKDHLREMDELKQTIQNASYEQKDPLLLYKFEALELFKGLVQRLNELTLSFLFRLELDEQREAQVTSEEQQRQRQRKRKPKVRANKPAVAGAVAEGGEAPEADDEAGEQPTTPKPQPARSKKIANRNQRVTVQYSDGSVKKDIKFKMVEDDLKNNRCVLVEGQ